MSNLVKIIFLITQLLITLQYQTVETATIKCDFKTIEWENAGDIYTCILQNTNIFTGSRVTVDSVEGDHRNGMTNDNVKMIKIDLIPNVGFMPANLDKFFTNLVSIIIRSSDLKEITSDDLRSFPKLTNLYLHYNFLKYLNSDVFKHNPALSLIWLQFNEIAFIDPNVFDPLKNLQKLDLSRNNCKTQFGDAFKRQDVLKVVERINNGDCMPTETFEKIKKLEEIARKYEGSSLNVDSCTSVINEKQILMKKLDELKTNYENIQTKLRESEEIVRKSIVEAKQLNELQDKLRYTQVKLTESESSNKILESEAIELKTNLTNCKSQIQINLQNFNSKLSESQKKNEETSQKNIQELEIKLENLQKKLIENDKCKSETTKDCEANSQRLKTEVTTCDSKNKELMNEVNQKTSEFQVEIDKLKNKLRNNEEVIENCNKNTASNEDCSDDSDEDEVDETCGVEKVAKVSKFISNGNLSYHGQWPWLAALFLNKTTYICGSSIITQWHLLTAAHCASELDISLYHALLGRYDLTNSSELNWQRRNIGRIYIHPDYNSSLKISRSFGDIAIMRVSRKIRYSAYIQPVCLPDITADTTNVDGTVVGYGQTEPNGRPHNTPNYVKLNSIDDWECLRKDEVYNQIVADKSFCANSNTSTPCQGDSGGGFYVYNKKLLRFETYGVVSHGIYRCNPKDYVAFVDVPKYIGWIREKLEFDQKANYCVATCSSDSDCPKNRSCLFKTCVDLCLDSMTKCRNNKCRMDNHRVVCE